MFRTDKLTKNIKFSLDELTINKVLWKEQDYAMEFFKTQTNLKKVTLSLQNLYLTELDEEMWYNKLFIHLFGNNLQLKTVVLSTYNYNIKNFRLNLLNYFQM